jgi:dTDP-4-amino-4,6-dideoxygalactose transaminase
MKGELDDLAIFGGPAEFNRQLHVGRPHVGDRDALLSRVNDVLDKRWLTNDGLYVRELERRISDYLGIAHCVATSSGTTALEIAARAAGLHGEVIVPSFTFVATAHALAWQGFTPVFCDVDPLTHNIDPKEVEQVITDETTGIIGVHLWGRPCDVDALSKIARRHGLKLLFDAAHAFGCSRGGRMIGGFGDAEIFSFHATKVVNTFEGGAIVTNDDDLASKARLMRNFGFADYDEVVSLGINGKMAEFAAAMGLTCLEGLEEFVARNRRNYDGYHDGLDGLLALVTYDEAERQNYHHVVVEVDETLTGLSRDELQEVLWAEGVFARRYFYPGCHRMEPYRSIAATHSHLPVTERLAERILLLPSGGDLDPERVADVCGLIRFAVAHGEQVRERLAVTDRR